MNRQVDLILGIAIGAALMYFFDPDRGRRRRALIRDQVVHVGHEIGEAGGGLISRARHLRNRARGAIHETRSRFHQDEIDDPILEARVRSQLGRLVADASNIQVSAEHGRVTLRGSAPATAMAHLVDGVQAIPGVHDVINRLKAAENA